jgi:hypothetical protein
MEPEGSLPCYKSPHVVPNLSHMNPIHILKQRFFKINFNIILPYTPKSPKWSLAD